MNKIRTFVCSGIIMCAVIFLNSCARLPIESVRHPPSEIITPVPTPVLRKDVSHTVAPGETVWRIAKMYDVDIKDITRANNLKSSKEIKMGQRLVVPGASSLKPIINMYPCKKWKYIIIHHSATD